MSRFHLENEELMEAVKKREEQEAAMKPEKDRAILKAEMDKVLKNTHLSQLFGLKELFDGIQTFVPDEATGESRVTGTNDLSLEDFGEAFCEALNERLDPRRQLRDKAANALAKAGTLSVDDYERALAALTVGLGL